MKFHDLSSMPDVDKDYVFRLELLSAGLDGRLIFPPELFLVAYWKTRGVPIKFIRKRDRYWIEGLIPLEVFKLIYNDSWMKDIIPGGERGPRGLSANTIFYDSDGRRLVSQSVYREAEIILDLNDPFLEKFRLVPSGISYSEIGTGYVKDCEILSIEALRHFVSIMN